MPSNTPNIIQSLRSAHDPHFKLSGKVGGLENKLTDQVSQIHKTLSKTFVTQRKTLVRVLGLEGRVSELESQQAAEEQAKEGIDDLLGDILGEDTQEEVSESEPEVEIGGTKTKTKPKAKKKPRKKTPVAKKATKPKKKPKIKATKKTIKAENLKKGTVLDDDFKSRVMGTDPSGQYLTPEERKRRFKFGDTQPAGVLSTETLQPSSDTEQIGQGESAKKSIGASPVSDVLTNSLKAIAGSLDNIKSILGDQSKTQQDAQEDARVEGEQDKAKKREGMLEKVMGPVKKVGEKLLKPFKSILESAIEFLTKIFLGRIAVKLFEWFTNPENISKVTSIFKFIKDWWPLIVGGILAVIGPGVTFTVGLIALVTWATVKIVDAVKSIFGFGSKIDDELKKGQSDFDKTLKDSDAENEYTSDNQEKDSVETESTDKTPAEISEVQNASQQVTAASSNLENPKKMAKGGPVMSQDGGKVEGQKGVDKVPAMLTEGEFVMSKGAVQEYGMETLANMNAAAGGTNKPTLMGGYKEGGFANITNTMTSSSSNSDGNFSVGINYVAPEEAKERVAAMGMPSMELMDGTVVPDFGKMGGEKVTQGLQLTRDIMVQNEAPPQKIAQIDELMAMPDAQPESIATKINQIVPGSMENTMMNVGDSITASARMNGGGLVQYFQGGGQVQRVQMGRGAAKRRMEASKIKPIKKKKVTVAYAEEKQNMADKPNTGKSEQEIPSFNVTAMRSPEKIKVLGISV